MKRVLLVAVLAALLLAPIFWLPSPGGEGVSELPASVMKDVRVVSRENGLVLWSLSTKEARIVGGGDTASLNRVEVFFPREKMSISANEGVYGLNDGALSLSGDVVARTDGYTITTGSAAMDSQTGTIESRDRVVMEGEKLRIVARGFRAQGEKVWLLNGIRAEFF